jgi:phage tail-like protein
MPDRHGPLRTGRFVVEIDGVEVSGFGRIELPARYSEAVPDQEGGEPDQYSNLQGRTEYDDLTMVRGARKGDTTLVDWRRAVEEGRLQEARKTVAVLLQDEEGETQVRWEFTAGWPRRYEPPTLETAADGDGGDVATESVVVVYDEMKRTT